MVNYLSGHVPLFYKRLIFFNSLSYYFFCITGQLIDKMIYLQPIETPHAHL